MCAGSGFQMDARGSSFFSELSYSKLGQEFKNRTYRLQNIVGHFCRPDGLGVTK